MQLLMFSYLNARPTGAQSKGGRGLAGLTSEGIGHVAGIGCVLNKPHATGNVRILGPDPHQLPSVVPNYLDDQTDRAVIRELVRLGWSIISAEPLASLLHEPLGIDADTVTDDDSLDAAIETMVASSYHFVGTCRMGRSDDAAAVVDEQGRVHGCERLRVADASVIPTSPAANTMLPTLMVAERLAAAARDSGLAGCGLAAAV